MFEARDWKSYRVIVRERLEKGGNLGAGLGQCPFCTVDSVLD